jgi:hypothetical protein
VPDGEIRGRGYSREQADHIAFIWNQDLEQHKRSAVIPDADLRHVPCVYADVDPFMVEKCANDWPTYPVAIYENNKLARIERLADQRIAWCQVFNEKNKGLGAFAVPVFAFAAEDNEAAFLDDSEGGAA